MRIERLTEETKNNILENLLKRSPNQYGRYQAAVDEILADVKERKDAAVLDYTKKFDKAELTAEQLRVSGEEIKEAYEEVDIFDTIAFAALTDKKSIEREIKSKIVQALMSKAGVRPIITAIKNVAESNLSDNVRIATTATTQTENKGRADVVEVAKKQGRKFRKVWRAVGDNRTRPAHRMASGQVQDFDKPFIVGGEKMMYPADISLGASAKNTINCRCRMAVIEYK